MSEENEVEQEEISQADDFDLDALQAQIDESLLDEAEEEAEVEINAESEEQEEAFDIDAALDSDEPIDLAGRLSEEDAETKATERGWTKTGVDKYGHRISALEFLERAPFFKKIDLMKNDYKRINEQLDKVLEQNQKIAKKSIEDKKKMMDDFKAEKEKLLSGEYLDTDDVARVRQIDKELESASEPAEPDEDPIVESYSREKDTFQQENDWYGKNRAMTALADKVGTEYATSYNKEHGHLPDPKDLFKFVIDEVKKDFPDKPRSVTKVATTQTRTVTNQNKSKKRSLADLPEDMRAIAKEVLASCPEMTEEEYLKTYKF